MMSSNLRPSASSANHLFPGFLGALCVFAVQILLALVLACTAGCGRAARGRADAGPPQFVDVAPQSGVRFRHTSGQCGRYYTAETVGSGSAFLDYDGDGRLDLFLVNSSRLPGFPGKGPFLPALYHQEDNGAFRDVTRAAGLALDCYGMGAAIADYDNDGDPDLLITSYGGSHLFRNDHGRFTDVTRRAGVTKPAWGSSAAWFDTDRDGDLDLFVASYIRWSPQTNEICGSPGRRHVCGPGHYDGTVSVLYRNNGDGTFTDVTRQAKVDRPNGKALGVVVWDMDDDGWPDFAVANDSQPNWLFRNNRDGTFTERGVEAGVAYGPQGRARGGMGIDTADYDHSGRETVLIGDLSGEGLAFFRPTGSGGPFTDAAEEVALFQASLPFTTFGARFLDYDLDGFPDVVTANGHVNEEVVQSGGSFTFEQRMQLFHNEPGDAGRRRFRDVTAASGPGLNALRVARGLAVGDVDGDGDPDMLVSSNNGAAALLLNEGPPRGHWLAVKLVGTRSNREGIGARVRVTSGGQTLTGWVRSGGSYCSEDERVARFGLGERARVEQVEVRWPSGAVDRRADVPADQVLLLREGEPR
jgi:hypothetical protein